MQLIKSNIKYDSRISIILIILIYVIVLIWGFIDYLVPYWGYFGIDYRPLGDEEKLMTILFSIFPCFLIPLKIDRPSKLAYWFLYILVYIPMVIGVGLDSKFVFYKRIEINFWTLIAFLIIGVTYKLKLMDIRLKENHSKVFWVILNPLIIIMFLYVLYLYKDNLSFVNLFQSEDVYSYRESGNKIQEKSLFAGHIIMWLSNAFFPLLIAVGLVNKDKLKILFGVFGLIVLYMTMANKQYLLVIFFMLFIYKLFKSNNKHKIFLLVLAFTIPSIILIYLQSVNQSYESIEYSLAGIFLLRTVYNSSFMSVYYNIFFENHPYTYFSHISGFSSLIEYPYTKPLGVEVGSYFVDIDNFNANANFLITDGLSSLGLLGMPIVALLCSFIFYLFDSLASKNNFLFTLLLIGNTSVVLMNVSLFTTLISGGLLFYILILFYTKGVIKDPN